MMVGALAASMTSSSEASSAHERMLSRTLALNRYTSCCTDADVFPAGRRGEGIDVRAVHQDRAVFHLVENGGSDAYGGLAAAAGANQSEGAAPGDPKAHIVEHVPVPVVAVADVFQLYLAAELARVRGAGSVPPSSVSMISTNRSKPVAPFWNCSMNRYKGADGRQKQVDGHDERGVIPRR
jgi:hypothetical protein